MDGVTSPPITLPAPNRLATVPVGVVAALTAVVHLVFAARDGRWFDEGLMLAIGRHHLDFGSADQPPVTPLLAALADAVAPDSQLVMRLPAVAATAGAVLLAALIARELGGDARAQTLTALAQATGIWVSTAGHWLTPYSLEVVQWAAICWLLARWLRTHDDRLLVVLGIVVGVAAQTQLRALSLVAVLALAVAVCGPRGLLTRPALWVGAALAALITAPTLIWQATHGWPQLAMGRVVASEAEFLFGGRSGVAVQLLIVPGVLGAALAGYGVVRLLRDAELRFLGVSAIALYVLVVVPPGRSYYLVGLVPVLAAAGAVGLQRRREAGRTRWRWVAWPAAALGVACAGAGLALSTVMSDPTVPRAIALSTADAFRALPADEAARTAVVGQSYIYAVYVDSYGGELGLPAAYSTNRSYGYFDPPSEATDSALFVGTDPGRLQPYFGDVQRVGSVTPPDDAVGLAGEDLDATGIWLLTGRTATWEQIWDEQRSLTVS